MADTYPAKYKTETDQYTPGYGTEEANPIKKRPKATSYGRAMAGEQTETPKPDARAGGYTRQGAINRKRMLDQADE